MIKNDRMYTSRVRIIECSKKLIVFIGGVYTIQPRQLQVIATENRPILISFHVFEGA